MLAFTEDLRDCLICPMAYYVENQCVDFASRRPYHVVHTMVVESMGAAQSNAARILEAFAADIRDDP